MPDENIDDKTFEQSVAELSISAVKSQVPAAMDYLMGFQLVDRSDDDTRSVGFFGFKLGEKWMYVPVFFVEGEVKGTELMYLREEDRFLPFDEDWVTFILQKKGRTIGSPQEGERKDLNISGPDLSVLGKKPTKTSSVREKFLVDHIAQDIADGNKKVADWAKDAYDRLSSISIDSAKYPDSLRLPKFAAENNFTVGFLKHCVANKDLGRSVFKHYNVDDFMKAAKDVYVARKRASLNNNEYLSNSAVKVLDSSDVQKEDPALAFLTKAQKQQVMRGNVIVNDGRPEEAKKKVYKSETTMSLETPGAGGLYDMLTMDGGFKKVFVLIPNVIGKGTTNNLRLVVDYKGGSYKLIPVDNIFVKHKYTDKEFKDALSGSGSKVVSSSFSTDSDPGTKASKSYVIVGPDGSGVIPFSVTDKLETKDARSTLLVEPTVKDIPTAGSSVSKGVRQPNMANGSITAEGGSLKKELSFEGLLKNDEGVYNFDSYGKTKFDLADIRTSSFRIILTDKNLRSPVSQGQTLIVPKESSFKVFKVSPAETELDPGTTADMYLGIDKAASTLKVFNDGFRYIMSHEGTQCKVACLRDALEYLMNKVGADEKAARGIFEEAEKLSSNSQERYWVMGGVEKKAAPMDLYNQVFSSDPMVDAKIDTFEGPGEHSPEEYASPTDESVYQHFKDENSYDSIYHKDIKKIQDASTSDQKDIFDSSAIGALVNVHNVGDIIEGYFGDFINAIDKLGRTVFLMHWHAEEIQERYGKRELSTLHSDVLSAFQLMGDVVLDLMKKSPVNLDAFGRGVLNVSD